ncbi:ABC transporter permease [Actinosynnema sp. NPDC047251]|uniref:ABC-type transporter, permease subunit n=1 Tax=Saccharothrix espanaensis (strain ATCC 51144 / DSM 44229 / JCM 9112 / NBRC 15066 / NRRL 15764) TaxID=1179773 RepID=K0K168_SACES|nr:ABC transporter permease [Saccharothrix espanaensis]CCH33980.1 ABC-type transporter, permease subunit [Saccharothrix espanaensis DSM 44229]
MGFARRVPGAIPVFALGLVVIAALGGDWLAPYDPGAQDLGNTAMPPSGAHWLGTDDLGRDVLSRLVSGARIALLGPAAVALGVAVLATAIGLLAGYRGGWVDSAIMRGVDLVYAVPPLLVAIVVVGVFGGGYPLAIGVLIALSVPADVRMVRSAVLAQRNLAYVESARTVGLGRGRILFTHLLPNVLPTVVANLLLTFVSALVGLAALAFLGLGVGTGSPDWGRMLAENKGMLDLNPAAMVAPAVLITVVAASVTLVGDRVYDRMAARGRDVGRA